MKTLITFILLFIVSCSQINAQSLYPLFKKAHQRVNQYNYDGENLKESIDVPKELTKFYKIDLKIISNALLAVGFQYDKMNDTILVAGSYESHLIGVGPYYLFAQSSKGTKQMTRNFLEDWDFEYKEIPEQGQYSGGYDENYYPLMYSGNVNSLNKAFLNQGYISGTYGDALRIVIKDGKIVYPSLLWYY